MVSLTSSRSPAGRSARLLAMAGMLLTCSANALPTGTPESAGMSTPDLEKVTSALQAHIDQGNIAGVVAAVVRDGKLVYSQALGYQNLETQTPMRSDSLFRIYSMTRPVTSLAILMLQEDGLLHVDDALSDYLPDFASQRVFMDPDNPDPAQTRERQADITLAHMMTHTSGIGSRSSPAYRSANVRSLDQTLPQVVQNVAQMPLYEEPGSRYRYGMSAEILGRVVEVVSGMDYESFLQSRILEPLGMTDTVFWADPDRAHRLGPVYRPDAEGRLRPHQMEILPSTERPPLISGGVGLLSSTEDFLRFSLMLLNGGELEGRRLLKPETVQLMAANALPEDLLPLSGMSGYWAGSGWSLGGFAVALDPSTYGHTVSQGEYWWDGSAGTRFWIDPAENMISIIMAQVSPASGGGFREEFKTLVYEAIEDSYQ